MRGYYYLQGEINATVVDDIAAMLTNDLYSMITIYISSNGGFTSDTAVLVDMINHHSDRVELAVSEFLISNAFNLSVKCDVSVRFLYSFEYVLVHKEHFNVNTNELLNKESPTSKRLYIRTDSVEMALKKTLTSKQYKEYVAGKDVYIFGDDAKKLVYATKNLLHQGEKSRNQTVA